MFTREELQAIRRRAEEFAHPTVPCPAMCPNWIRAYDRLADSADALDAMIARTEVPPSPPQPAM